jgi:hypothetical protein
VDKGVENDSKQAQTKQLTARGLIQSVSTRAINIYRSIYKAKWIPNTTSINTNASTDTNAKLNIINNNINGVDNVMQKNTNLVNSIDNTINIYDKTISGVDNIK